MSSKLEFDSKTFKLTSGGNVGKYALIIGVIGLIAGFAGFLTDSKQFYYSYLTAFMFWTTIGLGGLFFVMLHYLTNATWSVVIRRIIENVMIVLPFMAIFALPVLFGMGDLYHWSHTDIVQADELLKAKSGYLNTTFFIVRIALYFIVWTFLSRYLYN